MNSRRFAFWVLLWMGMYSLATAIECGAGKHCWKEEVLMPTSSIFAEATAYDSCAPTDGRATSITIPFSIEGNNDYVAFVNIWNNSLLKNGNTLTFPNHKINNGNLLITNNVKEPDGKVKRLKYEVDSTVLITNYRKGELIEGVLTIHGPKDKVIHHNFSAKWEKSVQTICG